MLGALCLALSALRVGVGASAASETSSRELHSSDTSTAVQVAAAEFGAPVAQFGAWRDADSECGDGTFANLHTFVQFFGYPRSGHTLVAMLLDAHPEVVMSNELNLLEKWDRYAAIAEIYMAVVTKALKRYSPYPRAPKKHDKNNADHYNYRVPGAWQGRWRCLRVIGDKKGSSTTNGLRREYRATLAKLDWIRSESRLALKFFHVIRNPFDNIATMITRGLGTRTHNATDKESLVAAEWDDAWMSKVDRYVTLFETNMAFARTLPFDSVLHVHGHELLNNATRETRRWCDFLAVACPRRYSDAVARVLYRSPWKSRRRIPWSSLARERIEHLIRKYTELSSHYSFDSAKN